MKGVLSSSTLENLKNFRQNIAPDTPTNPIHLLPENAMKKPLFTTLPHQQPQNTTENRKEPNHERSLVNPTNLFVEYSDVLNVLIVYLSKTGATIYTKDSQYFERTRTCAQPHLPLARTRTHPCLRAATLATCPHPHATSVRQHLRAV